MNNLRMNQLQQSRIRQNKSKSSENARRNEKATEEGLLGKKSFDHILNKKIKKSEGLVFSKHASDRLKQRNIILEEKDLKKIENAFNTASEKGIKNPLLIDEKVICIGNTSSRTVVTVMEDMKNKVFTNIDGVINI